MNQEIALVTGATAGIGFFTALALAQRGARVIITGRDAERGERAEAELQMGAGHSRVHFLEVDHAVMADNRELARRFSARWDRLDVLVNNVGGAPRTAAESPSVRQETADGYEATLALNFLAPFAVTDAFLPLLRESAAPRIVNVGSRAHAWFKGNPFEDLELRHGYVWFRAYARAKLLQLLWSYALGRRLAQSKVLVSATSPCAAWTPGVRALTRDALPGWRFLWPLIRWIQRGASPERAAESSALLASGTTSGGLYLSCNGRPGKPSARALDPEYQEAAFSLGVRLVASAPTLSPWLRSGPIPRSLAG